MPEAKLNEELIQRITDNIATGVSIGSVCALSGIGRQTYYDWTKRGKGDIEEGIDSIYVLFVHSVQKAQADLEIRLLGEVLDGDPVNAKWLLSRKMRDEYGDKSEIDIKGNVEVEILWPQDEEE